MLYSSSDEILCKILHFLVNGICLFVNLGEWLSFFVILTRRLGLSFGPFHVDIKHGKEAGEFFSSQKPKWLLMIYANMLPEHIRALINSNLQNLCHLLV